MPEVTPAYVIGGGLIGLGISRSLGLRGVPVTVFDSADDDICYHSRHVRVVRSAQRGPSCSLDELIERSAAEPAKPVLFVAGDRNLLFACRHREALAAHVHLVLPPTWAAETVVDKERFRVFAQEHGWPVPGTWMFTSRDGLGQNLGDLRFPLVLKPARSSDWQSRAMVGAQGHIKMIRVDEPQELVAQWERITALCGPPLVQEYVSGDDSAHFSVVIYRDRDGCEQACYCVQKLRLHPIHAGLASYARCARDAAMEEVARRVLAELDYRSVASVCFKRDPATGEARIFEINGRLPLAHAVSLAEGIDMPWLMYRDALGEPREPGLPRKGDWVALSHDIWAMREYRRAGEYGFLAWLRSMLGVRQVAEFQIGDPGPFLFFLRGMFSTSARAVLRRLGITHRSAGRRA